MITLNTKDKINKSKMRVGRGIGSGKGKTSGRGVKGQKSRSGVAIKAFEGGQMPLYRRLPKRGFKSMSKPYNAKVRTSEMNKLENGIVDLLTLKAANLIPNISLNAKIFLSGEVTKKLTIQGIGLTKGALKAVKDAGGKVEEVATAAPKVEKKDSIKDKPVKKTK